MKKEQFNAWLSCRVETQTKITMAACGAMVALGLLAFVIQGGLLYLILWLGYGSSFMAATIVLAIFAGLGLLTWLTGPQQLLDSEHDVLVGFDHAPIRLAPTLADAWTYAMGSRDSDQSIPQRIFNLMLLSPRLLWTAWYVFRRIPDVKEINVPECGKVLRMMLRKSERVEPQEVHEKYPDLDIPFILRQMSLIDGVVFLTRESVGMSLANRFKDDLERGMSGAEPKPAADASPFDG